MGLQILPAIGVIDGANTSYQTPTPYKPTTLRVLLNGQLLQLDCHQEDDPTTGAWTWLDPQPPRPGDSVYVLYDAAGDAPDYIAVCPLVGTVRPVYTLAGVIGAPPRVVATLAPQRRIVGVIREGGC